MIDDLVKRLLEPVIDTFFGPVIEPIKKEAADEIERLREALRLERQLKDDALRAFNEARAVLKEGE